MSTKSFQGTRTSGVTPVPFMACNWLISARTSPEPCSTSISSQ